MSIVGNNNAAVAQSSSGKSVLADGEQGKSCVGTQARGVYPVYHNKLASYGVAHGYPLGVVKERMKESLNM